MKIMVVDDAAFIRMMMRRALEAEGHQVLEAPDGEEAVEAYRLHRPDLVTMDITMPGLDGISALKEIRRLDPQARVMMVSAMGQQAMVLEALQAGALDFVVKPVEAERLVAAVAKAEAKMGAV